MIAPKVYVPPSNDSVTRVGDRLLSRPPPASALSTSSWANRVQGHRVGPTRPGRARHAVFGTRWLRRPCSSSWSLALQIASSMPASLRGSLSTKVMRWSRRAPSSPEPASACLIPPIHAFTASPTGMLPFPAPIRTVTRCRLPIRPSDQHSSLVANVSSGMPNLPG